MSKSTTDAQKTTERTRNEKRERARERAQLQDQCRTCERELSPTIARVCGDNDGCVPKCKHCVGYPVTGSNRGRYNTAAIAFRAHADRDYDYDRDHDRDEGGDRR
jgi:hypothetical protein